MIDLIKRLEAATEGSEDLDQQICDAVLVPAMPMRLAGGPAIDIPMWRYPDGTIGTALRFTRSLDAALTLYKTKLERIPAEPLKACVEALRQW